jgi:hypothetical protein
MLIAACWMALGPALMESRQELCRLTPLLYDLHFAKTQSATYVKRQDQEMTNAGLDIDNSSEARRNRVVFIEIRKLLHSETLIKK